MGDIEKTDIRSSTASTGSDEPAIILQRHNAVSRFFLMPKSPKPIPKSRLPCPRNPRNTFSFIFFAWVGDLVRTGYARLLDYNDIWTQRDSLKIEHSVASFNKKLKEYRARGSTSPHLKAIAYALRWDFFAMAVVFAFYITGEICMSVISRPTTQIIADIYMGDTSKRHHAIAYAVGSFLVNFGFMMFFIWQQYYSRFYAETVRSVFIAAIYEKIVLLSPHGRSQFPANKITALVTTDTNRIYMAARWTISIVLFLPVVGAMVGILVDNLGVSALPGFGLIVIGVFSNIFLSRFIASYRKSSIPYADKRIGSVRDTIENMRVIKYYGWEKSFLKLIRTQRLAEARLLERIGRVTGCIDAITTSVPLFAGMLSFAVLSILGHQLDPARVFPSLTLFTIFIPMSMFFSNGVNTHADAWPSVLRIEAFFNADEDGNYIERPETPGAAAVEFRNASFSWESGIKIPDPARFRTCIKRLMTSRFHRATANNALPEPLDIGEYSPEPDHDALKNGSAFPGLRHLNLNIQKGELVMVVGSIGSGKSSFLSTINGEMCKTGGNVYVDGKVTPVMSNWSLNATIRENILFGQEYDAQKYSEVTHVCSLESDFSQFAGRDFSEIGERGITLSGGQKARLSLARGVYNAGDIVLLDDVLSAVDSKVGKQIFDKCIIGYLKHTTRIMATHNLKQLVSADRVVYVDGSGSVEIGTLQELLSNNQRFKDMYAAMSSKEEETIEEIEEDAEVEAMEAIAKIPTLEPDLIKRQLSRAPASGEGNLVDIEKRKQGAIKGYVFRRYVSIGSRLGAYFWIIIGVIQACLGVASVMQSIWLNWWSAERYDQPKGWYIGFYGLILSLRSAAYACLVFSVASFIFTSSSRLHNDALENIYRAPMSYFDSTPLGRIISRFTDDVANLDSLLFMQLRLFLFSTSMLLASVIVVFVYVPWSVLCLLPIFIVLVVMLSYFRSASRELKRINSVFRSKMFSHVTETISGLGTILGYGRSEYFQQLLYDAINDLNVSMNVLLSAQMWLAMRIIFSALPVNFIVTMLCVYQIFDIDPSSVGMLLNLMPNVVISLAISVPTFTELENQLNSIERIYEVAYEIPQEAPYEIEERRPVESWPQQGHVIYRDASLRYRDNLPLALKHCSLDIPAGVKVGVCGRTGAGKSTMLSSLFRITELCGGSIEIDGVDISTIGLSDLRSRLSIIPQDPVLFQGTIRFNLDPFGEYSDLELWDTLRRCGAIKPSRAEHAERSEAGERYEGASVGAAVATEKHGSAGVHASGSAASAGASAVAASHKFHLDAPVDSAGTNFSLGERQLLTLARALVRQPKIIVLDEATANVDLETDMMIQRTIAREFRNCTIMCIAHRLQTILHYDKVVVMDFGEVLEEGSPWSLWQSGGAFRSMCDEAGLDEEEIARLTGART